MGPESIVFDIGMYKGGWSSRISQKYDPYIFGFEPVSSFYKNAEEHFALNPKVNVYNYGLGDRNRQDNIGINKESSSIFEKGFNKERITIRNISEVVASFGLEKIDLMNLNCEGGEYEILQELLATDIIHKIKRLLIQFHYIRDGDQELREKIILELGKTHIQNYCYLTVWELWTISNKELA